MGKIDRVEYSCDRCGKLQVYDKASIEGKMLESLGWATEPNVGSGSTLTLCQACDADFRKTVSDFMAAGSLS